ncbi:MAG: indolepyruvate ferredoxin oxidoreductase subunit alpha [Clostridiales bacterium]|nr:indolepyruvate ferredoxin oxidoreductase subunit alpha [Clostridiales bacterium]
MKEIMLGNEAVARGAYEAGVKFVSSYPGTPSTEITETIAKYPEVACEWAPNEKVGAEAAIGCSIRGGRAMTCMKHVGMNVCADPLFTVSYSGVNAGLVFCVADDPGMHSSQNEQDSRNYARASKVPMFEPSDSEECKAYTKYAFEFSEKYDTPVIIRLHTRVSHSRSIVTTSDPEPITIKEYIKDSRKYVMMPANAIGKHVVVEDRTRKIIDDSDSDLNVGLHKIEMNDTSLGIITAGASYQYVKDALPNASVLKLGMVWPIPEKTIKEFASKVDRLVIVEELDPFLETEIKALGVACEGKSLFTLLGEYSARLIRSVLSNEALPESSIDTSKLPTAPGRPPVLCAGCPHKGLFLALHRLNVNVTGDIGCYTLGALPPMQAVDTVICMGASVGMAHGFDKATDGEASRNTVGVIGDSTFLHSGITNLMNAVYNGSSMTLIILDNSITGMTGHQQNPSTGKNIRLEAAPAVSLELLCESVGVSKEAIRVVDPVETYECEKIVKEELARDAVSVIIARRPCALIPTGRAVKGINVGVDYEKCKKCGACGRIMCPALIMGKDRMPVVDTETCNNCGLCVNVCKFGALSKGE